MIISNEGIAIYREVLEAIAAVAAVGVFISSLDDMFIDVYYWIRKIYRWVTIDKRYEHLRLEQLQEKEESYIAIMVPAWQEYDVIAQMVENTVATMDYRKFIIFIGTYQNDAKTTAVVDRMVHRFPQIVHRATVMNDGPTCKADCMNWIIQSIFLYEEQHNMKFSGLAVHDSEDVIHPLELRLFNYLIDRKDLIQVPVLSLDREWYQWVAGTYLDDFAEWHEKEMVVRESLTGLVPGSGVATCYSRNAIHLLSERNNGQPFNIDTLTEDYDLSFRLKGLGTTQVFVRFPIVHHVKRKYFFGRREKNVEVESTIATREYFPHTFRTAYRQRARWILGVAFQGWQQMGWRGSFAAKYLFFRDRKAVWAPYIGLLTYVTAFGFMTVWILRLWGLEYLRFPNFVETRNWLFYLYLFNFWFFINRIGHRIYFVSKENGLEQGLFAVPRMVVGSIINLFAVSRAWRIFITHLITGKRIAWDKTQHFYPNVDALKKLRKQTGELLLSWNQITQEQLKSALNEQKASGKPIGQLLLEQGAISQEKLADVFAAQAGVPRAKLEPAQVKNGFARLPGFIIQRHRVVPFSEQKEGVLHLAVDAPPSDKMREEIAKVLNEEPQYHMVCRYEVDSVLGWYKQGDVTMRVAPVARNPLGDFLVKIGALTAESLVANLSDYDKKRDGGIGAYLIARGVITEAQLNEAIRLQKETVGDLTISHMAAWRTQS